MAESVWTERDRAVAVGLEVHEGSQCPGCGHPIDEVWSPDEYNAHVAEPVTCGRCRAIEKGRHNHEQKIRNDDKARDFGLHWTAHRRGETPLSERLRERRKEGS